MRPLQRELIVMLDRSPVREAVFAFADQVTQAKSVLRPDFPVLSSFFRMQAEDDRLEDLAETVRRDPSVLGAYIQPQTELPVLNSMLPSSNPPPVVSPDFTSQQGYLERSPDGIGARAAWRRAGGRGAGVKIIDIEWEWNLTHEALVHHRIPIFAGAPRTGDLDGRNHGTAVLGVTSARGGGFGVTGICGEATVQTLTNTGGITDAEAIVLAAELLDPGDILILEMHRPGPKTNFMQDANQIGYIPVEWWPYDLAAIQYAAGRGIVVVETAGNGGEDLDDSLYDVPAAGFPPTWRNPFRRSSVDSGAILVGAGAPPPGTHTRDHGPARSRLDFSNYGSSLDAQGWGQEVTTCGYGEVQGGLDENYWYTDEFAGTSSATPIVAGALACVQGARKAKNKAPCTPAQMRHLLRLPNTGAPQQDGPPDPTSGTITRPKTQRIGQLPNLSVLIAEALRLP